MAYLKRVRSEQVDDLKSWVARYFAHDGLVYDASVEAAIDELLLNPVVGSAWFILMDGKAIGYAVMTYGFDHEAGGRIGVVTDFFIDEASRGRGIGTAVMKELIEDARLCGLKSIELFVLKHNGRAKKLYESFGFRPPEDREYLSLHLASS